MKYEPKMEFDYKKKYTHLPPKENIINKHI